MIQDKRLFDCYNEQGIVMLDLLVDCIFGRSLVAFDTKGTVIELNNVKIEAFPSHHFIHILNSLLNI